MTSHTMNTPMSDDNTPKAATPSESADSPRAFVTASGFVLQMFGGLLTFGALVAWGLSALMTSSTAAPTPRWTDHLSGPQSAAALLTLGLFVTLIGGLGLMAVGVGMQGEKKGSALAGVVVGSAMSLAYLALAVLFVVLTRRFVLGGTGLLLAIFCGAATVLAVISHTTMRLHPPPTDYNLLTAEVMDEVRRQRDARRKEFDL